MSLHALEFLTYYFSNVTDFAESHHFMTICDFIFSVYLRNMQTSDNFKHAFSCLNSFMARLWMNQKLAMYFTI